MKNIKKLITLFGFSSIIVSSVACSETKTMEKQRELLEIEGIEFNDFIFAKFNDIVIKNINEAAKKRFEEPENKAELEKIKESDLERYNNIISVQHYDSLKKNIEDIRSEILKVNNEAKDKAFDYVQKLNRFRNVFTNQIFSDLVQLTGLESQKIQEINNNGKLYTAEHNLFVMMNIFNSNELKIKFFENTNNSEIKTLLNNYNDLKHNIVSEYDNLVKEAKENDNVLTDEELFKKIVDFTKKLADTNAYFAKNLYENYLLTQNSNNLWSFSEGLYKDIKIQSPKDQSFEVLDNYSTISKLIENETDSEDKQKLIELKEFIEQEKYHEEQKIYNDIDYDYFVNFSLNNNNQNSLIPLSFYSRKNDNNKDEFKLNDFLDTDQTKENTVFLSNKISNSVQRFAKITLDSKLNENLLRWFNLQLINTKNSKEILEKKQWNLFSISRMTVNKVKYDDEKNTLFVSLLSGYGNDNIEFNGNSSDIWNTNLNYALIKNIDEFFSSFKFDIFFEIKDEIYDNLFKKLSMTNDSNDSIQEIVNKNVNELFDSQNKQLKIEIGYDLDF
ncbi:hypothetical protein [Mycoplasmopsis felis]|uniref:hypothetical protein n=1 Tax=Mycoplasmopsis felis TaxID=33923 RepID=UPI0005607B3F|nr:hypothetical protein [Mycoplasmopsis felis]